MVYITGDTHSEFERFSSRRFPQQKEMTRADYLVICGDFGGVWDNSSQQRYWLDWLEQKPFTTLFVDGNHENFDLLQQLPCREWQGGQVHVVRENILHLMRGEIFTFAGRSWFAMGGGASHDMPDGILDPEEPDFALKCRRLRRRRARFRVKGESWWPQEMPSQAEYSRALENLERAAWQVDCILTHCAPSRLLSQIDPALSPDLLTDFLEDVDRRCRFEHWFFGHYHRDLVLENRYILQQEGLYKLD